ncbi:BCD family MFS transporter [Rhizobium sp. TRM95796]|uniref:BCD family MFS transporter n=1 Tax=Rhizobium sp. TRM95796 TaxID=2979862 RepID=UPI0021E8384D|nr:BCD family MFS transporter [Rhizobium sp. TRM95796]MCV3768060.1 BCD family MFS transporter [Rhizobium sp. TRM95796]
MQTTGPTLHRLSKTSTGLGWLDIVRLGLVQAAIGAIVVLTNSTLNRVMVVELGLAAVVPGLLVGLHYAVQITRPLWGHRSDAGGSRASWILIGLAILALGGVLASATTFLFPHSHLAGLAIAVVAYVLIGMGVGASGTSLLALIATRTAAERRASAATITWMMMIFGIIATSIVTGTLLDPYSPERLVVVTAATGATAFLVAWLAIYRLEARPEIANETAAAPKPGFNDSLKNVWRDRQAKLFTLFIFLSMLAYSTQDLILEPFAGLLFGMSPGESTRLSGSQHMGVFLGMALVGGGGFLFGRRLPNLTRIFIITGCFGSALALVALCFAATLAPRWPLQVNVFALGFMNGVFAVAAIGAMMTLATRGASGNAGMRMGVWGAAQAISFGIGGLLGSVALDLGRRYTGADETAFALVFGLEALLFLMSTAVAFALGRESRDIADADYPASIQPAE